MANVISRIELHGYPEDSAQYESLHGAMKVAGFRRTIVGTTETAYELPHATYYSGIYATVKEAHAAAVGAAATIQTTKGHGVVTSGTEIFLETLTPA
jgi:hypothetical protein